MKKCIWVFLFVSLVISSNSCSKPNKDPKSEDPIVVDPKKALTGTFIDFWEKQNWSQSEWDNHFKEMKDIGLNTVIVQFTAYGDFTWFNSANTFTGTKYPNALSGLLSAAKNNDMSVYIGLYFSEEYWDNQTNVDWLTLNADRCIYIATEIYSQFGENPAFKGWYIPHEPEPHAYNSEELVASFKDNLVNRISDKLHTFDSRPVSIAAFYNSELTSTTQLKDFMTELCKCNLQIIMLQDGIGVNHVSLDQVGLYYSEADNGLYANTYYNGEFWTDLETFSEAPQGPVTIDRIKNQLQAELAASHIKKAVSYQYYSDMCPTGPGGSNAGWLRNDYLEFIKSLK
jgi:hypothetical protein